MPVSISAITATRVCLPTLDLAVDSVLRNLKEVHVVVFMPYRVQLTCTLGCRQKKQVEFRRIKAIHGVELNPQKKYHVNYWYSMFMTDPDLWRSLHTEWVLVFQADTLVCRPLDMTQYQKYDYVGGITPHIKNFPHPLYLNGGLALHRRKWTIQCALSTAKKRLNEDAKWNTCARNEVLRHDALSFASDNGHTGCFTHLGHRICPFGVHKPWTHGSVNLNKELEANCSGLASMRYLLYSSARPKRA